MAEVTTSGALLAELRARRAGRESDLNARRQAAGLPPVSLAPRSKAAPAPERPGNLRSRSARGEQSGTVELNGPSASVFLERRETDEPGVANVVAEEDLGDEIARGIPAEAAYLLELVEEQTRRLVRQRERLAEASDS